MSDIYGLYKHYKGGVYKVLGEAKHSETEERLVVYQNIEGELWVRPYNMFFEQVIIENRKIVNRFERIKNEE